MVVDCACKGLLHSLNENFLSMTKLYFMWKHLLNIDIVNDGICEVR